MAVGYELVNFTRCEVLTFAHISASTKSELAGNAAAAAMSTWYMLECAGDQMAFVSDTYGEWPFPGGSSSDVASYVDVTDRVVAELVGAGILKDLGRKHYSDDLTEYTRVLENVWLQS
tara:strand:- start:138 stop:491 length:354 start_codon:yes stop_codon:yes gene_type:complete